MHVDNHGQAKEGEKERGKEKRRRGRRRERRGKRTYSIGPGYELVVEFL